MFAASVPRSEHIVGLPTHKKSANPVQQTHKVSDVQHRTDSGNHYLRILSVHIRRVRGLAIALNGLDTFGYLFETVGTVMEATNGSSLEGGIVFLLEELGYEQKSIRLKCSYTDVDEMRPELYAGHIYRCVGKFSTQKGIYQCYSIKACEERDLHIFHIFQMHSDNVISQTLLQNS